MDVSGQRFSGFSDDDTFYSACDGSFGTIYPIWTFSRGNSASLQDLHKSPHPAVPFLKDHSQCSSRETLSAEEGLDESLHLKSSTPVDNTFQCPSPDEIMSFADEADRENSGNDGKTPSAAEGEDEFVHLKSPTPVNDTFHCPTSDEIMSFADEADNENSDIDEIMKENKLEKDTATSKIAICKPVDDVYEFTEQDEEEDNTGGDEDLPVAELKNLTSNCNPRVANTAYAVTMRSRRYIAGDLVYVQANLPKIDGRPFWLLARIHREVLDMGKTPFYWIEYKDRYQDYRPKSKWISGDKLLPSGPRTRKMVTGDNAQFQLAAELTKLVGTPLETDRPVDAKRVKRTQMVLQIGL